MNKKRWLSVLLALVLGVTAVSPLRTAAAEAADTRIVELKTDDMVSPMGIDSASPRFSWQMQSAVTGQKQTAYKIIVTKGAADGQKVWDSGKTSDSRQTGIVYAGRALEPSTTYYWTVVVWDKDGKPLSSDTACFETGLMSEAGWKDSQWISVGTPEPGAVPDGFHYTVEGDFSCQNNAVGILFNYLDDQTYHMWQINSDEVQPGRVLIRQQVYKDNSIHDKLYTDITDLVGGVAGIAETPVHIKIDVTKTEIKTFIDNTLADTKTFAEIDSFGPVLGKIGVRSWGEEKGTAANLKMTDYTDDKAGRSVYDYDFADYNPFGKGEVVDGALQVYHVDVLRSPDTAPVFRKAFSLPADKTLRSARLYATGLGVFDMYLNGRRVGAPQADGGMLYDELKPGFTQLGSWPNEPEVVDTEVQYFTYDVTTMLMEPGVGQNALSALVTSGWWTGGVGGSPGKNPAVRAQLLLTYDDGTSQVVGTDTTWKSSSESPVRMADIWNGESYDATYGTDWQNADFNDTAWARPEVNTEFDGRINPAPEGARVRVREDLERHIQSATVYQDVIGAGDAQYGKIVPEGMYAQGESFALRPGEKAIVDLGQNFAGWSQITAKGERGTRITLRHGETLNDQDGLVARGNDGPEGSLHTVNLHGAAATATYTMAGGQRETYHSSYTFYGFRYVEITASRPITVYDLRGLVVTSVHEDVSSLRTSDADINQLISNIRWGQYSNFISIPTDCPQRAERQGWTNDTLVFSTTAAYLSDSKAFLSKWMTDMRNSQRPDGNYPEVAPRGCYRNPGAAGWSDAGVLVPYNIYKMYGDKSVVEENYASMEWFMDYMQTKGPDGGDPVWGDWLGYESNDDTIKKLIGACYYAWDALAMSEMAQVLGKTADAEKYEKLYESQKAYFQRQYISADGSLKRTEQTVCLLALKLDLLPDAASYQLAKEALLSNIQRNGGKLQTGFVGTSILMPTLSEIGASDTAYQILLQRGEPSWLYCVDQGATTIWETWDCYTADRGYNGGHSSFNHYAKGAVAEWMYSYMAGIQYDMEKPGFQNIVLQPNPAQVISSVNCAYDSPYGRIVSNWKYEADQWIYDAVVPANATADVYLPVEAGKALAVNGKAPDTLTLATDGIEYERTENGKAVFHAVAGSFQFVTDVTPYNYVTLINADPGAGCLAKINGGPLQEMPSTLKLAEGEEATLEVFPGNSGEYAFACFTGDQLTADNKISLKAGRNQRLTVHFHKPGNQLLTKGAVVTAATNNGSGQWAPANLVDGILTSVESSKGYTSEPLGSDTPSAKPWIEFDLGQIKTMDRFHLYPRTDQVSPAGTTCNFPVTFAIKTRNDAGESWQTVAAYAGDAPFKMPLAVQLEQPVSARYIRLEVAKLSDHAADEDANRLQLAEFGVYNTADTTPVISAYPEKQSAAPGETLRLLAAVTPACPVVWSVAGGIEGTTVSENGMLTIAPGETANTLAVTAAVKDDSSNKAVVYVEVRREMEYTVTLDQQAMSLKAGTTGKLAAAVAPEGGGTLFWNSSDPAVAAVDQQGIVTALSSGRTTVTAALPGGAEAACSVTVYLAGDLTGDGKVNISDVMAACKVLARKSAGVEPTPEEIERGDLTGEGKITITDVMAICKILAQKD